MHLSNPMYKSLQTSTSSAIRDIGCDPVRRWLLIRFRSGEAVYRYTNVHPRVFLRLRRVHLAGGSVGKEYHRSVRPMRYAFVKL